MEKLNTPYVSVPLTTKSPVRRTSKPATAPAKTALSVSQLIDARYKASNPRRTRWTRDALPGEVPELPHGGLIVVICQAAQR